MAVTRTSSPRRESLTLRILPELRDLIDRGAQAQGKNCTDFILEAAKRAAEEAVLERTLLTVSPAAYAAFLARLEQPAQPNERLRHSMQTSPWDRP